MDERRQSLEAYDSIRRLYDDIVKRRIQQVSEHKERYRYLLNVHLNADLIEEASRQHMQNRKAEQEAKAKAKSRG